MENKRTHLQMIQGVINRMSSNSFALKGWAVTLIAGIFALASKDADKTYFLIAYIPIIIFWALDAYYLLQEKLYRALYDKVRLTKENDIDFNMNAKLPDLRNEKATYWNCLVCSPTEWGFYIPLALLTAGIVIITHM